MERTLISESQLAVLLCVCRLPVILFGLPGDGEEQIRAVVFGEGIRLLISLPVCLFLAGGGELQRGFFGGLFRFAAAGYLLCSLGGLMRELGNFAADTLYPGSEAAFFGLTMLALILYGARMGLESTARAALPVLVLFGIGMALTALGVREEIRLVQLRPVESAAAVRENALRMGLLPEELLVLAAAGRRTGGSEGKRRALWGFGLAGFFAGTAAFLCGTVLGGLQKSSAYPFFRVETLMRLSVFQRMDAWFMGLWTAVILIRGIALIWTAEQLLTPLAGTRRRFLLPVLTAVSAVVIFIGSPGGGWAALYALAVPVLILLLMQKKDERMIRKEG